MGLLQGNYELDNEVESQGDENSPDEALQQEYYKAALQKLGGSIAFVMKDKTFLWTGDEDVQSANAKVEDDSENHREPEDST